MERRTVPLHRRSSGPSICLRRRYLGLRLLVARSRCQSLCCERAMNAPPPAGAPAAACRGSTLGEEARSPRGRASHSVDGRIDSVRDDVILAHSAALRLSRPTAACTNQSQVSDERYSAFAWARARPSHGNFSRKDCFVPNTRPGHRLAKMTQASIPSPVESSSLQTQDFPRTLRLFWGHWVVSFLRGVREALQFVVPVDISSGR